MFFFQAGVNFQSFAYLVGIARTHAGSHRPTRAHAGPYRLISAMWAQKGVFLALDLYVCSIHFAWRGLNSELEEIDFIPDKYIRVKELDGATHAKSPDMLAAAQPNSGPGALGALKNVFFSYFHDFCIFKILTYFAVYWI